jgi:peptidyl-prolyl cis-trans isomerase SurA
MLFSAAAAFGQGKVVDKVVAQVGDNIILLSDLEGMRVQTVQNGGKSSPKDQCLYLEEMMYQSLLVNQAELDSVKISDEQVDAEMENRLRQIEAKMKGSFTESGKPMTIEEFYGKTRVQIKEEFRSVIKKRLQGQEVERKITGDINVSPREVDAFYNRQPKDSLPFINTQLGFQQIAIFPVITKEDKARAKAELEDIRRDIVEKGKSFETMARINSDDPGSAQQGGLIEATRGMMVKPFEATAYNLKEGEVSQVFETEYGYHIMKLLQRKGDDYVCLHILKTPAFSNDSLASASARLEKCYQELRENKITWEDAVKKYSNDPNTKENLGIITNPITGEQLWDIEDVNQVDPQMFQLTDRLERGEFTMPGMYGDFMERKTGLRIVRLMERTQPHVANLKDDYVLIRTAAENEKKQKAILDWTASRISTAYIRIDEDYRNCPFQSNWTGQ